MLWHDSHPPFPPVPSAPAIKGHFTPLPLPPIGLSATLAKSAIFPLGSLTAAGLKIPSTFQPRAEGFTSLGPSKTLSSKETPFCIAQDNAFAFFNNFGQLHLPAKKFFRQWNLFGNQIFCGKSI
jgi:hypothetical protein